MIMTISFVMTMREMREMMMMIMMMIIMMMMMMMREMMLLMFQCGYNDDHHAPLSTTQVCDTRC